MQRADDVNEAPRPMKASEETKRLFLEFRIRLLKRELALSRARLMAVGERGLCEKGLDEDETSRVRVVVRARDPRAIAKRSIVGSKAVVEENGTEEDPVRLTDPLASMPRSALILRGSWRRLSVVC